MKLTLSSPAFGQGQPIPKEYTADGQNMSPPLKWSDPPTNTQSLALIADDPDAPRQVWVHWVVYNIPAASRELPAGTKPEEKLANGTLQGTNDFGRIGYGGPSPPPGKPHRYFFHLYALDTVLQLPARATKDQVLEAMKGHVMADGELIGKYGR